MGEEKNVDTSVSACGSCVGGIVQNSRAKRFFYRCEECKKFESDEAAIEALWSLWTSTNTFLALGDDESAETLGEGGAT